MDNPPTILCLYDKTGIMSEPFVAAGWNAVCVDIQHPKGETKDGAVTRIGADMTTWVPPRWLIDRVRFVAAFPPCDHLAVSGARWFQGKGLGALASSVSLVERAAYWCEWFQVPYLIENPVSTLATYWRKPDYTFHPWQFAGHEPLDCYTKKTCLWTGGGFVMPTPTPIDGATPDDRIHKAPPSEDRKNFRSATPRGFARAVFEANFSRELVP